MEEYINTEVEINASCFEQDLDEIGYEPEQIDDSNEEAAELYGY